MTGGEVSEPKAALDYRALLEAHVVTQEGTALLRAVLENVDTDHFESNIMRPPTCARCLEPWPCPRSTSALERLWNAIK